LLLLPGQRPDALAELPAEHDAVFGTDTDDVPRRIVEKPALLDRLSYMQAVIEETLRLFPVANGIREGPADLELVDAVTRGGNWHRTGGFNVLASQYCTQRNPRHWVGPGDFVPEAAAR